ncbi:FMN-binding glutamate synthase family protein [Baekduia soli]|uniref:FMN-binding glutamate synthase family protein n=1 Tax=Baekduia soli TaxID=496014 RepID=A0A5B8U9L9_9ACTN|nr:FMN-binding glutamate synthase family protein [Baekduia soli]QEC49856.1 FMN-binding glutamate synthase family protein [Baekduia soli]
MDAPAPSRRRPGRRSAAALLTGLVGYDLLQRRHAILRNFPVVGHLRYLLELFGPELRQYIVTSNDEERPFSRDQRRWVYASAKHEITTFAFGSDDEMEQVESLVVLRPVPFGPPAPAPGRPGGAPDHAIAAGKVLGARTGRRHAFRPASVVNVSGMSYGALSPTAVEALNRGCAQAGCLHNTGEGGLAPAHRHGGELVLQIGTGYFGCRDETGRFSLQRLVEQVASAPVRALEIKLSQGAKPGLGGMLPAAKVTPEIAAIRGVPAGRDCISPPVHSAFGTVEELVEFTELLGAETGLPVGIKSAVGGRAFWDALAARMAATGGGPDFVTIDGAEGGTGASPLAFADHVALPFKIAFSRAYAAFAEAGLAEDVVFAGAGRLGFPDATAFAFALGCDLVNVGREAMLAIGCVQAQRCHTGACPSGVATQNRWLMRGLDPTLKSARTANYITALRAETLALARTCGVAHPALLRPEHLEIVTARFGTAGLRDVFGYRAEWPLLSPARREQVAALAG